MAIFRYPHCGRQIVCSDTMGIHEVWKMEDAYKYALETGCVMGAASYIGTNTDQPDFPGTLPQVPTQEALCGITDGIRFKTISTGGYVWRHPFEIVSSLDGAQVDISFRMLNPAEFATAQFGANGLGARAQRVLIQIFSIANPAASTTICEIYADRAYYAANVSPVIGAKWIDLITATASGVTYPDGATFDGINVFSFIDVVPPYMRQAGRANPGYIRIQYELPLAPNGGAWPSGEAECQVLPKVHPVTGDTLKMAGVVDFEARAFRTQNWTQGTASLTLANQRAITVDPQASPAMGDQGTASLYQALRGSLNAAYSIGFTGFFGSGNNSGYHVKPIVGDYVQHASNTLTASGEIPQNAVGYVVIAYLKTRTGIGGQTINVILEKGTPSGSAQQNILSTTDASGNAERWFYGAGTLSTAMRPVNGSVERLTVIIESIKSTNTTFITPFIWDGIQSILIRFF